MSTTRTLLLVSIAAAALSIMAEMLAGWQASLVCGLVAFSALAGHVATADVPAVPRLRWALMAGIGLLALTVGLRLAWHEAQTNDSGWFLYGPLRGGHTTILDDWRRQIDLERLVAVADLVGVVCFGFGMLLLPKTRRPGQAAVTAIVAVLLASTVGLDIVDWFDEGPLLDLLGTFGPSLLACLLAAGIVALSGTRMAHTRLLPFGALLLALGPMMTIDSLASSWMVWRSIAGVHNEVRNGEGEAVAFAVVMDGSPYLISGLSAALTTGVLLAGPIVFVLGVLRVGAGEMTPEPGQSAEA